MQNYVQRTDSQCFAVFQSCARDWHSVPTDTFQTLVVSFVLTFLDYGNSILAGLRQQTWNDLPEDVTSAESVAIFRRLLKTQSPVQ